MTYERVDVGEEAESSGGIWSSLQQVVNSFSSSESKTRPSSIMFRKLFRYISGVNEARQEIEMTAPVLMQKTLTEDEMTTNMCFYLDSAAQDNPPTPEDPTVVIETNKPLKVAVYEFGGYAMSDSVGMRERELFANRLGNFYIINIIIVIIVNYLNYYYLYYYNHITFITSIL